MTTFTMSGGVKVRACRGSALIAAGVLALLAGGLEPLAAGQVGGGAITGIGSDDAPVTLRPAPITSPVLFDEMDKLPEELADSARVRPAAARALAINFAALDAALAEAPEETLGVAVHETPGAIRVRLPMPDGRDQEFIVVESSILSPELARQHPEIKTYLGQGVTDRTAVVRMHRTPLGFGASVRSGAGIAYIDRYSEADAGVYASYWVRESGERADAPCHTKGDVPAMPGEFALPEGMGLERSGPVLRTFRLAVGATGEFTQAFGGGTVNGGLAAIVANINRVAQIFEQEVAVRLQLVAGNTSVVFTDGLSDPYPDFNDISFLSTQNTFILNALLGTEAYDVGLVFASGARAGSGFVKVVCGASKGAGAVAMDAATDSASMVVLVAHQLGHMFGASHSFNSAVCAEGRVFTRAFEPGSGSTIMGNGSTCGADSLTPVITDSSLYFNQSAFDEILAALPSFTCAVATPTGNIAPKITGLSTYTIPFNTPFAIKATGTDLNGDALTYSWEQRNLGPARGLADADDGLGPVMPVFAPTTSSTRNFPSLSTVLGGAAIPGETPLTVARTGSAPLRMRLTARDNRAGGGGVNTFDVALNVRTNAGPFSVTVPAAGATVTGNNQQVNWVNTGLNNTTFGAQQVRVLLSFDNGLTWTRVLSSGTPNDGAQPLDFPSVYSDTARLKIEPASNIFFAIGPTFKIRPTGNPTYAYTGRYTIDDSQGTGNGNGRLEPGETGVRVNFEMVKRTGPSGTNVPGVLSAPATPTVTVTTANANYASLPVTPAIVPAFADTPFVIDLSSSHPCGDPVTLRLSMNGFNVNFDLPTGDPAFITKSTGPFTYTYDGPPQPIFDPQGGQPVPTFADINVTDDLRITRMQVRINGNRCTTNQGATTVGIDHTSVGQLAAFILGPDDNTFMTLFDEPGGADRNFGNNLCQTLFDDSNNFPLFATGTFPAPPGLTPNTGIPTAPYTGTYTPDDDFSVFTGFRTPGLWSLIVTDTTEGLQTDRGNIRSWSILFYGNAPQTCAGPVVGGRAGQIGGLIHGVPNVTFNPPEPLTPSDLASFLMDYAAGDLSADVGGPEFGAGRPDGQVTVDDLLLFVEAMGAGK